MADLQRADNQVMCWSCQRPKPFTELALNADGIPSDLCRTCDARPARALVLVGDCEPAWVPWPRRRRRPIRDLPDIDQYQEQPHA